MSISRIQIEKSEVAKFKAAGFRVDEETAYFVTPAKAPKSRKGFVRYQNLKLVRLEEIRGRKKLSPLMNEFLGKTLNCYGSKIDHTIDRKKLMETLHRDEDLSMKNIQTINARISALIAAGILEIEKK